MFRRICSQSCLVVETWSQNNVTRANDPCVFGSLLIRPVKAIFGAEHTMNKLAEECHLLFLAIRRVQILILELQDFYWSKISLMSGFLRSCLSHNFLRDLLWRRLFFR